jgi:phosphohistidine swiveling domain-containing protein
MPDWNPAEIIGISPKPLAYDLYSYLVTDNIWAESRKFLGYKDVGNNSGLVLFAGRPYVDVRMSFSSFIPKDIETHTADKLVETFILKLKNNPEDHDKVEFNIALTAFDFNFDDKLEELSSYGFGEQELQNISESYKELTQNIVLEKTTKIEKELAYSDILSRKRAVIFNSDISIFDKVFHLLEDCKKYGTLPFANLARMGFIGSILLKSLLSKDVIDKDEYEGLLGSVHSVATDFSNDFNLLLSKDLSKNEFLDKYGHLRPGTYEITSKSYNEGCDDYIDYKSEAVKQITDNNYKFSKDSLNKISEKIHQNGFDFSVETLLDFIKRSTEAREKSKFEFTKNLSMVLDLISEIGQEFNICRGDLSYLNLENILRNKNSSSRLDVESNLKVSIENNKKKYLVSSAIQLPELIFGNKDVEMFFYPESKPNYITHHIVSSEIVVLNKENNKKIDGKIVLIENADPGFDWIFSYRIKGLVTRYGGAASHMAIRCAEFDLPAAIGCGELFTSLEQCSKLEINCPNQKITGYQ